MTTDRLSGALLVLFAVAAAVAAAAYPLGTLREPGPGLLPLALALLLASCGLAVGAAGRRAPPLRALRWPEVRHAGAILAACAFAALALERLGYRLTVLVLVLALACGVERRRPLAALAVATLLSGLSFYVFADVLKVPLPRGPLGI